MLYEMLKVGELRTNCYVAYDPATLDAVVIDPGGQAQDILKSITKKKLKPVFILHTHGHPDHFDATEELRKATGAKILVHEDDAHILESTILSLRGKFFNTTKIDERMKDGQHVRFGGEDLLVIHTPGHSRGGACFYNAKDGVLFSGDTLFAGDSGRTDLPGSSPDAMKASLRRLLELPDATKVLPGHGWSTTIGDERAKLEWVQ